MTDYADTDTGSRLACRLSGRAALLRVSAGPNRICTSAAALPAGLGRVQSLESMSGSEMTGCPVTLKKGLLRPALHSRPALIDIARSLETTTPSLGFCILRGVADEREAGDDLSCRNWVNSTLELISNRLRTNGAEERFSLPGMRPKAQFEEVRHDQIDFSRCGWMAAGNSAGTPGTGIRLSQRSSPAIDLPLKQSGSEPWHSIHHPRCPGC